MKVIKPLKKDLKKILPERFCGSSKNDYGRVLSVAGSRGMSGAAFLASYSALKSGCGLVYSAIEETERSVLAGMLPEAVTIGLKSSGGEISSLAFAFLAKERFLKKIDIVLVGPGLGVCKGAAALVFKIAGNFNFPMVIDADALNCFAEKKSKLKLLEGKPHILTPHEGEMERLIGKNFKNRFEKAAALSRLSGGVIVFKGHETIVTDGEFFYVNHTGNSALSKAGTGDVLAGLISGLWAQRAARGEKGKDAAFESAVLGVWLHGRLGELASKDLGERCVLAGELLNYLPAAFLELEKK